MLALTSILALASVASAHFTLKYPEPRGNSFLAPASQWVYPCANINSSAESNRTLWPLNGGAVAYNSSHDSVFTFINLGLGTGEVSFNISLTHELMNVTGKGVLCLPNLAVPAGLTEGQNATIQVVTVGHTGSSLYNCADIQFSANAPTVDGAVCSNTTGVSAAFVHEATEEKEANSTATNTTADTSGKSAASGFSSSMVSAVTVGMGAIAVSYLL